MFKKIFFEDLFDCFGIATKLNAMCMLAQSHASTGQP